MKYLLASILTFSLFSLNSVDMSPMVSHADLEDDVICGSEVLLREDMEIETIFDVLALLRLRMHISAKLGDANSFNSDSNLLYRFISFVEPENKVNVN